jgi:transposase
VLADGGYTGQDFADEVLGTLGVTVQIAKRNERHTFEVIPQRWIVERSFARLEKCHRLRKNCECQLNTSLQFVHLGFLRLILRRF